MDELLGDKPQFNPPFIHHTSSLEAPGSNEPNLGVANDFRNDGDVVVSSDEQDSILIGDSRAVDVGDEKAEDQRPSSPIKKKPRKSPIKSAAGALESAMKARVECEEKRLEWEKQQDALKSAQFQMQQKAELEFKQKQLDFEREKWNAEVEQGKARDANKFDLEKFKIEKEAEVARARIEKEFELEKLKLGIN